MGFFPLVEREAGFSAKSVGGKKEAFSFECRVNSLGAASEKSNLFLLGGEQGEM